MVGEEGLDGVAGGEEVAGGGKLGQGGDGGAVHVEGGGPEVAGGFAEVGDAELEELLDAAVGCEAGLGAGEGGVAAFGAETDEEEGEGSVAGVGEVEADDAFGVLFAGEVG